MSFLTRGSSSVLLRRGLYRRPYTTESVTTEQKQVGALRGGLIGFLVGVTFAGSIGYYYLLEEYNHASESLLVSVEELQKSTEKVRDYAQRIETLDRELAKLKKTAASAQQLEESKIQLRKLYDTLNMEHLELKTHIWGLGKCTSVGSKKRSAFSL
ncbi:hypothetical protein DM01DRAFT_1289319 [Hesseltinella vesiculosa]|uniref:Uncharacterized protein n=1 Tax=Hesseltinella vesiculosa TaxID=101127 RepID=A0A1X2GEH5_9FUNG|nr:hypothetical protein DM01DRAFT_1289319 [Hesseltinella vesiculosa]